MFKKQVQREIETLFASSKDISDRVFTYDQIGELPEPVQRYFKYCLNEGQNYISYVRMKHGGTFRMKQGQKWIPIVGEEYFTTQRPGFIWFAKIRPFPLFWIAARDMYFEGKGNMLIKLLSIFTVADAKSKEMDEASLIRFLAEAAWFPTALLPSENLRWEGIDSESARATISDNGLDVSAVLYFNERGEITQLIGDRYRTVGRSYSKDKWVGYYRDYERIGNIRMPQEVEVAWDLSSGEFSYAIFRLSNIEFNSPTKYE